MPIPTLLPLATFAKRLGLHPLHFYGVDAPIGTAASRVCIHPIMQYSWQSADGVSREELAEYIYEAEYDIANLLGYWPLPKWTVDERVELVERPGFWYNSGYDIRGDRISVKAQYGQMISGGIQALSLIDDDVAVVYTDPDGDGYDELATIGPIATSVTDIEEIAVYYPDLTADEMAEWGVRPIQVTISGGMATITCRREQLVKRSLYESLDPENAINGLTDSNFLTVVDVYRKYNDPSVQVQLQWRSNDQGLIGVNWWCGSCAGTGTCTSCGITIQPGCITTKDKALGIVTVSPGNYDAASNSYDYTTYDICRRPDNVRLWYYSGYRNMALTTPNLTMAREWELAIAKLAVSKLDRQICSCKAVADVQAHWNTDLRRSVGTREKSNTYRVSDYELENNPFGTTVAAMDVWRLVRRVSLGL